MAKVAPIEGSDDKGGNFSDGSNGKFGSMMESSSVHHSLHAIHEASVAVQEFQSRCVALNQ